MKANGAALTFEYQPVFSYPFVDLEVDSSAALTGVNPLQKNPWESLAKKLLSDASGQVEQG